MGVNIWVDKAATQESAVALNQGLQQADLKVLDRKEEEKRTEEKSDIQKYLDSKDTKKTSNTIISALASKLASSGVKLAESISNKAQQRAKDELDLMFERQETASDEVNLINHYTIRGARGKKQGKENGEGGEQGKSGADSSGAKQTVAEYTQVLIQFIVNGGTDLKKNVEKLEAKLRQAGVSENEILSLNKNIRTQIRSQIAAQMKEGLIKRIMNDQKSLDWTLATKELLSAFNFAFHNDKLGGWDFGGYNQHLQGTMDEMQKEVESEVKLFVSTELERTLVARHLGVDKDDKNFRKVIELGSKAGVDLKQFFEDWTIQKIDLGISPPPANITMNQGGGADLSGRREKTGFEFTQEDKKDLLINQLRALYMQRAIKGDLKTVIETSFKIMRTTGGLIKLGIQFQDIEQIKKEGIAIAKVRVTDQLREALYERATLHELQGPAFNLIEGRIKSVMNNLERLGIKLSKLEFDSLRDDANYRMFDVARSELEQYHIINELKADPALGKKIYLLVKLMKRLKEESQIETSFDFDKYAVQKAAA